jgi:hypothetical protein
LSFRHTINHMQKSKAAVDVRSFLAFWGGPAALCKTWKENGVTITKGQVQKWQQRKSIPSKHLMQAVTIAHQLRRPIDLDMFINTPD